MNIKRYDSRTGQVHSSDGSVAPAGFERTRLAIPSRKNLLVAGMLIAAVAILIGLLVSYQLIYLFYSLLTIYIFLTYLVMWTDGANKTVIPPDPARWPDVTVIIPSYNSGHTIHQCLASCQKLDYPGKVSITVVDDGSTDGSYEKLKEVKGIRLLRKVPNAGKAAALNYGIEKTESEIICCIDSDTYPEPAALRNAVRHFYTHPRVGSVVLFVCAHAPRTLVQRMQEIEYWVSFGFFFKTVASIDGLYVTPGPMALYKKEMFDNLGHFDTQNLTEDMEIALRMQRHGWKIRTCHEAVVWTEVPKTFGRLFRQRLRWFRGGIMNMLRYSDMLFNPKYGTFGLFVLPTILGAGFFAALSMLWVLLNNARVLFDWLSPWVGHPAAMGAGFLSFPSITPMSVDSAVVFGLIGLSIWFYFVYSSFQISREKISLKHVLPMAMMIFVFPLFNGFTFLMAYVKEFSGGKYDW